jgi:hypothetical protein
MKSYVCASAALCGCDKRRFLRTVAVLCVRALLFIFSPLTSVANIFGVLFSLRGMQASGVVWSASNDCCRCCASESILNTAAWEENELYSNPDRNIEPF